MEPEPPARLRARRVHNHNLIKTFALYVFSASIAFGFVYALVTGMVTYNLAGASTVDQSGNQATDGNIMQTEVRIIGAEEREYSLEIIEGATALQALVQLESDEGLDFEYNDDPVFGAIVSSINGQEAGENEIWSFSVNGVPSEIGPSYHLVDDNDELVFRLEGY